MKCPKCGHHNCGVTNAVTSKEGDTVKRYRKCSECGHTFPTFERQDASPMDVASIRRARRVALERLRRVVKVATKGIEEINTPSTEWQRVDSRKQTNGESNE